MRLNVDQQMKLLLTKSEDFWRDLLNEYLINVSNHRKKKYSEKIHLIFEFSIQLKTSRSES